MKFIEAPVLLVTFNRPDTTKKVLNKIKEAKVKKLYFFNDGPREGNQEDLIARNELKKMADNIDWNCEVITKFEPKNLGCGLGVSSAITWAFENEDRLIILEDDCVPALPFFDYCNELLEKYKNDFRVWKLNGNNFIEEYKVCDYDYFFSNYGNCAGWATWKRSWDGFDLNMSQFVNYDVQNRYQDSFSTLKEAKFWKKHYTSIHKRIREVNNPTHWATQFDFHVFMNGGLNVVPRKNLISNIGYTGVHTSSKGIYHDKPIDETFKIVKYPEFILISKDRDNYYFKNHIKKINGKKNILYRIIRKLKKMLFKRSN